MAAANQAESNQDGGIHVSVFETLNDAELELLPPGHAEQAMQAGGRSALQPLKDQVEAKVTFAPPPFGKFDTWNGRSVRRRLWRGWTVESTRRAGSGPKEIQSGKRPRNICPWQQYKG